MDKKIKFCVVIFFISCSNLVFSQDTKPRDLNKYVNSHVQADYGKGDKPLLDFQAIENWRSVGIDDDIAISRDGKYVAYSIRNNIYRDRDSIIVQTVSGYW